MANTLYQTQRDPVLLCIATNRVQSEIKYENAGSGSFYPHIYGPLNIDAVVNVVSFKPTKKGKFALPREITKKITV